MMKKLIAVVLALALLVANAAFVSAEEFVQEMPETILEIEADAPALELPQLSSPPPAEGKLSLLGEDVSPEMVDISTQIYENLIALDPSLFMLTDTGINTLNGWDTMTDSELAYVKNVSAEVTESCADADEKILKVAEYVSKNTCYDYDYAEHNDKEYEEINHSAYDVLVNSSAVCYGYATAAAALLLAADVPCVLVYSPNHAWNMAYNGQRWVLFDTTWMSRGVFEYGELQKSDVVDMDWFDYTIEQANAENNHVITGSSYTCYNNTIFDFPVETTKNSFTIPENVTGIDEYVFYGLNSLKLSVSGKLESVGRAAFYNCASMDGTVDLSNLVWADEFAFYGCTELDSVVSLSKLTKISKCMFYQCYDLDGVIDISAAETIGEVAFISCVDLDGFENCGKLTDIGLGAFFQCDDLESIDLSHTETVGASAFYDCKSLKDAVSFENMKTIGEKAFQECTRLGSTVNLKNAESIGKEAFLKCSELGDVIIGNGVTQIPEAAFYECGAEDIILPVSLQSIGDFVFAYCDNLKHFYYAGTEEQWNRVSIGSYNYNFGSAEMIYNYAPHVNITKPTAENPGVIVTYEGVPTGEVVLFCEYNGNQFLGVKSVTLTKEMTFDLSQEQTNKITIFIFDDFFSIKPATKAESVTVES